MNDHILISKAKIYNVSQRNIIPELCTFSQNNGYWIDDNSFMPMMLIDDSKRPKPQTKKFDIETGEDQKGE